MHRRPEVHDAKFPGAGTTPHAWLLPAFWSGHAQTPVVADVVTQSCVPGAPHVDAADGLHGS